MYTTCRSLANCHYYPLKQRKCAEKRFSLCCFLMTSASVTALKLKRTKFNAKYIQGLRVYASYKLAFCSDVMFVSLWTGSLVVGCCFKLNVVLGWILCTHKWWIFPSDLQVGHILAATLLTCTFNGVVPTLLHGQANCIICFFTPVLYLLCIMESKFTINLRCWCCIYFALNLVLKNWYSTLQQHQKFLYNILCVIANSCNWEWPGDEASSFCLSSYPSPYHAGYNRFCICGYVTIVVLIFINQIKDHLTCWDLYTWQNFIDYGMCPSYLMKIRTVRSKCCQSILPCVSPTNLSKSVTTALCLSTIAILQ